MNESKGRGDDGHLETRTSNHFGGQETSGGLQASDTDGFRLHCPHCRERVSVEGELVREVRCPACGSDFNLAGDISTASRDTPRNIGPFELLEQLGYGQFGVVWKARDTKLDRLVALKIPRRSDLSRSDMELFLREARAAAQLSHPNIVAVYEAGRHGDLIYIVSDLVRGVDLRMWLADRQPTFKETAELCAQIADALQHAHEAGVVHRDLKPANVMLDLMRQAKIMDFGLARRDTGEVTVTAEGQLLGTPAYMSPEQALGEAHTADRRTDVYSLGVMLYEMLTGERPFRGERQMLIVQILSEDPRPPRRLNQRIPRDLETICLKCIEKRPDRRYNSAADVASDLRAWLEKKPIQARPVGRWGRAVRWCQRRPAVAGLLATIVLLTAIAFSVVTWQMQAWRTQYLVAEEQRDRAESYLGKLLESVDQMLVDVGAERLRDEPHLEEVRRLLMEEALAFFTWFDQVNADSPLLRRYRLEALVRTGKLHSWLEDHQQAKEVLSQALARFDQLPAAEASSREIQAFQLEAEMLYASAEYRLGATKTAGGLLEQLVSDCRESLQEHPEDDAVRLVLAPALDLLDRNARANRDWPLAEQLIRERVEVLGGVESQAKAIRLAGAKIDLANFLANAGRNEEADATYQDAIAMGAELSETTPLGRRHHAAALSDYAAFLNARGRVPEAEDAATRSIDITSQLVAEFPATPSYRRNLMVAYQGRGHFHHTQGSQLSLGSEKREKLLDQSAEDFRAAISVGEELTKSFPNVESYADEHANSHFLLALLLRRRHDLDGAATHNMRAIEGLEAIAAAHPERATAHFRAADARLRFVFLRLDLFQPELALESADKAVQFATAAAQLAPNDVKISATLAASHNARLLALEHLLDEDGIRSAHQLVEKHSRATLALRPDSQEWLAKNALFLGRRAAFLLQYPKDPEADFATAKSLLDEFASTTNKSTDPFFKIALAARKLRTGEPEASRDELNAILGDTDLLPATRLQAMAWLALACAQTGDVEKSRTMLDAAEELQNKHEEQIRRWAPDRCKNLLNEARGVLESSM